MSEQRRFTGEQPPGSESQIVERIHAIDARAPAGTLTDARAFRGAAPNSLALSPDGGTLYATLGGSNAISVIPLKEVPHRVAALIPTGWYPTSVRFDAESKRLYVANGKGMFSKANRNGPGPYGRGPAGIADPS